MALEKIRSVYQYARHVIVFDASIEAYKAQELDIIEQLARIFTSGWLRRLWTLQEGALAESLYYQFADCAVSLEVLKQKFALKFNNLRHQIIGLDLLGEYTRLQAFFHSDRVGVEKPNLFVLN